MHSISDGTSWRDQVDQRNKTWTLGYCSPAEILPGQMYSGGAAKGKEKTGRGIGGGKFRAILLLFVIHCFKHTLILAVAVT